MYLRNFLLILLFSLTIVEQLYAQQEGVLEYEPHIFQTYSEQVEDTIMWKGVVEVTFDNDTSLNVIKVNVSEYRIYTKNNELVCNNSYREILCKKHFSEFSRQIEKKVKTVNFYYERGPKKLLGNGGVCLFYMKIFPG